ncbi:hypothetical protein QR680_006047 [Steinernema hermaphroditum]|uniref:Nuclear receptor domain-containing protein n=1 Tax=Steinernema hermaphroditum TaxID=289476 RepID=A0AA39HWB7_9BILA|nr:hypothetical protein QR680_006047 [Steinernema hermaphroditum]
MSRNVANRGEEAVCLVCGGDASGFRCGVSSCRACAAFFRRSLEKGHQYKCQRVTYDCDVSKNVRDLCKYCRYKKCREVGMMVSARKTDPSEPSISVLNSFGEELRDCLPEVVVEDYNFKMDTNSQMQRVVNALQDDPFGNDTQETSLQALLRAYQNMVPGGKPVHVQIIYTVSYRGYVQNLHEQMERIAKWAIHCREFAHLPIEDKRKIYCNSWHALYAIERCARTVEFMGPDTPARTFLLTDSTACDLFNYEFSMPEVESAKLSHIVKHFEPFCIFVLENLIVPMRDLNLTTFEIVYLCMYKLWNIKKVRGLHTKTYTVATKALDDASDELHEYYINELRITNYASRLAAILKLIDGLDCIFRCRSEILLTADLCKVYNGIYGESEFRDYARNIT